MTRSIGYVVFPGFGVMAFSAVSVFEAANAAAETAQYDITLLSETGGPVRSSIGVVVETQPFSNDAFDTLIVGGGGTMSFTPGMRAFLGSAGRAVRRLGATCTGQFFLADAGLLDGRRVTTHWHYADDFRRQFPKAILDENRLFLVDGPIWTSAGMTAGIDQALAMVEEDLGSDLARRVAKNLVLPYRRAGGLSQSSAMLELESKSSRVQEALAFARGNLGSTINVEQLAQAAKLSPRQFTRVFRQETGRSPAKALEELRIEAARVLIREGRHSIELIARQTGFNDRERMRRAFIRAFGEPPQQIRRAARTPELVD
ncbi:GlxA family transcriptional regulator [Bosea sp. TAB14]|uniref:GlxA family transcriptional regulator n=1 Tax=Bosea sp. TAB14 TaxID=3237481 RepID=UPI003F930C3B